MDTIEQMFNLVEHAYKPFQRGTFTGRMYAYKRIQSEPD